LSVFLLMFLLSPFPSGRVGDGLFAQTAPDSTAPAPLTADSVEKFFDAPAPVPAPAPAKPEANSIIVMSYVKEKVEHSPDSTFFNILKITNNNGSVVQGVVRISVPMGWKIISAEETNVTINPNQTEYIPIRVSLARTATGGTSFVISATLISNRSLFTDKNQNSVSKACYITIPKKTKWDIYPVQRTIYFDRYAEYASFKLKITNRGNGSEVVKLEFNIGSAMQMYGALGNKYFSSVELKPHRDTVLSYQVRYIPIDDASELWNRDFQRMAIKIIAISDTLLKRTSVNFKHLESTYYNELANKSSPLTIEMQLQNLLSEFDPKIVFAAYGDIILKNYNTIDYNLRIPGLSFSGYDDPDFGASLWQRMRFRLRYTADKWQAMVGDISSQGINMLGIGGRGIAGSYKINDKQKVSAAFATAVASPVYSGDIEHAITLPNNFGLNTAVAAIINNYNKVNNYGLSLRGTYSFLPGHRLSLLLGGTQTRHLYNDSTFTDPNGNFIITNDPGKIFYGYAAQLQYQVNRKKARVNLNANYSSKHFSQYYNGRIQVNGSGQYFINKQYYLVQGANIQFQDPAVYNLGILYPENKYLAGNYRLELADKINSRLTFFTGPRFQHISRENLKINYLGDSIQTRFASRTPAISFRLNYKNNINGFISPYLTLGYTYITSAQDSSILVDTTSLFSKAVFFNASAGLNAVQKYFGLNIIYHYGPHDILAQTDYYYFGSYGKTLRIMPYFNKYYFNRKMLLSSYNSYYYQALSNSERITLNARLSFFFNQGWTFFVDNNMYFFSRINEGGDKTYSRKYYLNLGFKKTFDIAQPGLKYYDLKVICFKDINGNKIMDNDEHGISDIVISVNRQSQMDSVTKKAVRQHGQFSPAEMVTDNFGQIIYYNIPEGEFDLNVFPLVNLKDLYNINGQTQKVGVSRDTTYYIPFVQSYRVIGHIILNRDEYSSNGMVSVANIRITATDSAGNSFPALTSADGSYTLYVPQAGEYKVNVNNVFGEQFILQESEYTVSFDGAKEFQVDFIFSEKKRQININGNGLNNVPNPNPNPNSNPNSNPNPLVSPKDTSSSVIYRIQIGSNATKIPASEYAAKFKGAQNVKEYIENGVYKYTSGEFQTWDFDKATDYKDQLKTQGYKDAFIVFFKDNKRVAITPSSSSSNDGITYRVQLTSTATRIPQSQFASKFPGVSYITEYVENGIYKYTGGDITTVEDAQKSKEDIKSKGYKDAFVVPFKDGKPFR